jgi:hypothetical protein
MTTHGILLEKETLEENRGGILGRSWDKNLKNFALCYSQSPPPADFTPPYRFLGLEISTATAESWRGLSLHYLFVYL